MLTVRLRSPVAHLLLISTTPRSVIYLSHRALSSTNMTATARTPWDPSATPYPAVRRDESFSETFKSAAKGSVQVKDPYNWLQDPDSAETKQFVADQGAFTKKYLDQYEHASKFKEALTQNFNYPRCTSVRERERARLGTWLNIVRSLMPRFEGRRQLLLYLQFGLASSSGRVPFPSRTGHQKGR